MKRQILYCGRVHPEKGLNLLVNSVQELPSDVTVKLVGPWEVAQGGGGQAYLHQLRSLDRNSRIDFIGPVFDSDQLSRYYNESTIFIYPSVAEKGETFGLAPLEAMAWKCVPVVSDLDCFKDFITQKVNGLIFDHRKSNCTQNLAESLSTLLVDDDLRRRLSEEAYRVNETHSLEAIGEMFLSDFRSLVHRRSHEDF
ncbi:MAG: glycosyltransferase family 4 protein [bacterium]|nr:glycosyltransferase family 4 protein [bacterium]